MTKFVTIITAAFALAIPSAAMAGNSGTSAEYHPQGSECGELHGAFGYFGKDNNQAGGTDGQKTGAANSAKGCQRNL